MTATEPRGRTVLRPFQVDAVSAILQAFESHQSALLLMATGLGKTEVFTEVVRRTVERGDRALVVAHREELVEQAAARLRKNTGVEVGIEMADRRVDEWAWTRLPIIVGSVQTLGQKPRRGRVRVEKFKAERFGLVVFDEAHHALAATWRRVWDHFAHEQCRLLGATATPDRGDEKALGQVFETVAYDMGVVDGVKEGWLVPVKQRVVHVQGLDFSTVRTTAGDLNGMDLDVVLRYEQNLQRMTLPFIEIVGDRRALNFTASVAHAHRVSEICNRVHPGRSAVVDASTPRDERRMIFRDFADGRLQFLHNCGIATEGWDDAATDGRGVQVIGMMRPTKSRALYCQMAGRGTRPLRGVVDGLETAAQRIEAIVGSAKPGVLLVDFVGNAGRHRLMHAGDVLGGDWDEATARTALNEAGKAADAGEDEEVDVLALVDRATLLEREAREAKQRQRIVGRARFTTQDVDPFAFVGIVPPKVSGWRRKMAPSQAQLGVLNKEGVPNAHQLNRDEASAIITRLFSKPTEKQAKWLRKHGRDPAQFDRRSASDELDRIFGTRRV